MKKAYLLDIFKFLNENPSPTEGDLLDVYSDINCKYNLDSYEREYVRNILYHGSDYGSYYESSLC
jgi:hypothetical protein